MINEKQYWNEGAAAYRDCKDILDNPYDFFDSIELEKASAWLHGYRVEQAYWEPDIDDDRDPDDRHH